MTIKQRKVLRYNEEQSRKAEKALILATNKARYETMNDEHKKSLENKRKTQ